MDNITVTGDFGRKPALAFTGEDPSEELLVEVLHEGDGPQVEAGDARPAPRIPEVGIRVVGPPGGARGVLGPARRRLLGGRRPEELVGEHGSARPGSNAPLHVGPHLATARWQLSQSGHLADRLRGVKRGEAPSAGDQNPVVA